MNTWLKLTTLSVILSPLAVAGIISATAQAQPESAAGPITTPNVKLNIQSTAGTCPESVGLWWLTLPYEGGAEHTVIPDTRPFSNTTKLVSSNKQFVEYVANLNDKYASCVGQTQNKEYTFYNVQFKNKQAYFRVDLRKIQANAKEITYKTVAASRPYVRWAIAD
ncbi:hypothetical protein NIES2107_04580 [Nostoc carneum NIES-2107]|nr:hypothetical protein NIES2107_04580 [Nostoc carneum NIES-2107]